MTRAGKVLAKEVEQYLAFWSVVKNEGSLIIATKPNKPTHWEISVVYEGALEEVTAFESWSNCITYVLTLEKELLKYSGDWEIYSMPHYCKRAQSCNCAQWINDHSPIISSERQ